MTGIVSLHDLREQIKDKLSYEKFEEGSLVKGRVVYNDGDTTLLLGFVMKNPQSGSYYWMLYSELIPPKDSLSNDLTIKEAKKQLKKHAAMALAEYFYVNTNKIKVTNIEEFYDHRDSDDAVIKAKGYSKKEAEAFRLGIAYAHLYCGMPRPHDDSKFLTRDRYGTFKYHDARPKFVENFGQWSTSKAAFRHLIFSGGQFGIKKLYRP